MTQSDKIRRHIETYGSITSHEAFTEYGITRLSARIWDLRHKDGLDIKSEKKTGRNRFNELVSYAVYTLEGAENERCGS